MCSDFFLYVLDDPVLVYISLFVAARDHDAHLSVRGFLLTVGRQSISGL